LQTSLVLNVISQSKVTARSSEQVIEMADAIERAEIRNECLPIDSDDVLQFRGERATYERRYYYNGLRREPLRVFTSDSFAIHVLNDEVKAVVPDSDEIFCRIEGLEEEGAILLSAK
jgi:hypothetical protein